MLHYRFIPKQHNKTGDGIPMYAIALLYSSVVFQSVKSMLAFPFYISYNMEEYRISNLKRLRV
jgi:hypothetical protein